ncbi:MAG: MFS transporter [Nanoarchaeota archaeon]
MRNPFRRFLDIREVEKDVEGKSEKSIHAKQKALEKSIKEGSAASASTGLGDSYITPFADALGAQPIHIGLLSSLSSLFSPLAQLGGSRLMMKKSRKKIVLNFVLLNAIMWLAIAGLAFFAAQKQNISYVYLLIVFYTLLGIFGGIAFPAWFSWMGDIVPEKDKGKYFSKRNVITGIVSLIAFLIGAFILNIFEKKDYLMTGFIIIFSLAFFFRTISFLYFRTQYSPKLKMHKSSYFSLWSFLKRFDNYGKFSIYLAFFNFAVMVASPFFALYMLQELGYNKNYLLYTTITISSSVFYLIFTPFMGKISDKYGNTLLLVLANICFVFTPLLWLFSKNPFYLVLIPQLVAGIANAALTISTTNFTYDAVSQEKRGVCIAYTNLLIGIGSFSGALLGGFLLSTINFQTLNKFFFIFIFAAILRMIVALLFLPKIKEEKKVKRLPPVHVSLSHPFKTLHAEIGWFKAIFKQK